MFFLNQKLKSLVQKVNDLSRLAIATMISDEKGKFDEKAQTIHERLGSAESFIKKTSNFGFWINSWIPFTSAFSQRLDAFRELRIAENKIDGKDGLRDTYLKAKIRPDVEGEVIASVVDEAVASVLSSEPKIMYALRTGQKPAPIVMTKEPLNFITSLPEPRAEDRLGSLPKVHPTLFGVQGKNEKRNKVSPAPHFIPTKVEKLSDEDVYNGKMHWLTHRVR
jgi:hypothetical protein